MLGTDHVLVAAGAAFVVLVGKSLQLRWTNGHNKLAGCPENVQRTHAEMLIRHDEALFGDMGVVKTLADMKGQLATIEAAVTSDTEKPK
jgi:hypothetical protein